MSAVPNHNLTSSAIISLQDVAVQFEHRPILQQINFDLFPQEIVTLIGPNGAGKSTFVKVLLSILKPTQGKVIYHQKNLKFAYVPQKFNPSHSLPLRVQDVLNLESCPNEFKQQIIQETSVEKLLPLQIQYLSGGERQRVLLARALLRQPHVLVLDEPMQGLDIQSEAELYAYIRSLPQRFGCSVLIVSHDLQWVMQGTQRVICLNKHICCSGSPENVQQHPEYQAIFGKHRMFYQHHHDHCQHHDVATPCQNQQHQPYPHLHGEIKEPSC
ncbi:metal ABC transporter ATP-binding protein [Moraxella sp. ZY210820]|uniref:metal ABC transporter ATP-binding protein n=1 Tax=unclassified Moraxella TaxID=2685852 RepID=UPI002730710D|nr:metal ABC transporter ATP-binding protein [Moraxella sp. ZY210820]